MSNVTRPNFKRFEIKNSMSADQLRVASLCAAGGAGVNLGILYNKAAEILHTPTVQNLMNNAPDILVGVFSLATLAYVAVDFSRDSAAKTRQDAAKQARDNPGSVVALKRN